MKPKEKGFKKNLFKMLLLRMRECAIFATLFFLQYLSKIYRLGGGLVEMGKFRQKTGKKELRCDKNGKGGNE